MFAFNKTTKTSLKDKRKLFIRKAIRKQEIKKPRYQIDNGVSSA
jgi:hypothetical protein